MKTHRKWVIGLMLMLVVFASACTPSDDDPDGPGDPRDKFIGEWQVRETNKRLNYQVTISYDPTNSSNIILRNFADSGSAPSGLVVGNNIEMAEQTIGADWTLKSSKGVFESKTLVSFSFVLDIDGVESQHSATFEK